MNATPMDRTIETECDICEEKLELEIPDTMLVYRTGTRGASGAMRCDIRTDGRVVTECSEGHEVGDLLVFDSRTDLPEYLEKQPSRLETRKRRQENKSLDDF